MLRSRIIPCLLIHNKGLVKTVKFRDSKYIGDPINAVKIFNEKEVDELIVLDIDATIEGREPNYNLIEKLAVESRMPLCYGGGIKTAEQAKRIIRLGVEKVSLSSGAIKNPEILTSIVQTIGTQSVVVTIDVKKKLLGNYDIYVRNGLEKVKMDLIDTLKKVEMLGAGEIVINSIDHDGVMDGYDYSLAEKVREAVDLPLTILGGASCLEDMSDLQKRLGIIGAGAGSIFVFKGKYKAVLINYPSYKEKLALLEG